MPSALNEQDPTTAALLAAVRGEFRLVGEIGRGGMGVVYHAIDERLERPVAIKTLPPHLAADPAVRARFLREARTAGALSHPNIVPIHSAHERGGVVWFVMALVEGESLADRVVRQGPIDIASLLPIVRQVTVALDYAHAAGVVHRDIKAENVLLDRHGRALLTDFGIARVAEAQPMTATGTVLGTVHYMSPEQVSGDPLDGRSDLYALGVLMFYALSGRFPFERPTAPAVLVAHVTASPPRVRTVAPDVPLPIDDVIATLLAKSPDARLGSAKDVLSALAFMSAVPGTLPATMPTVVPTPARMSSEDAQQVWARAAELQANTGAIAPPPNFAAPRELLTRGFDADEVREAARDAGIDDPYVSRALAERERQQGAAVAVRPGESMTASPNRFLGAHTKVEYVASVDREVDPADFEEIADEIRAVLGQIVSVSAVGRTLTVSTMVANAGQGGIPRYCQVTVSSRNGRTQVRAFEDLSQLAGGLFGGLGIGGGAGGSAIVGAIVARATHSGPEVVAAVGAMVLSVFGLSRFWFMQSSRKKQRELDALVRRVVEHIAALPPAK